MAPLRSLRLPTSTPDSRVVAENAMNLGVWCRSLTAYVVFLLHQSDDRAAFCRFVGVARQQCRLGCLALGHAGHRNDLGRQTIAERDRAGLVQQQRIDVAGCFHGAARHRQYIKPHKAIHAGDADRRQKSADGGGDQGDEKRHQHHDRDGAPGIGRIAWDRRGRKDEDDGQADQQDGERDLVRSLLPLGAFHQLDHAVKKR